MTEQLAHITPLWPDGSGNPHPFDPQIIAERKINIGPVELHSILRYFGDKEVAAARHLCGSSSSAHRACVTVALPSNRFARCEAKTKANGLSDEMLEACRAECDEIANEFGHL